MVDYHEYLDHNELGLACDMLDAYANDHVVGAEFWAALASAADKMVLDEKAARYRGRTVASERVKGT